MIVSFLLAYVSIFIFISELILSHYTYLFLVDAANADLYCKLGVPFVMGTTGGDRHMLYKTVQDANVYAVISPQMGKQVFHEIQLKNVITILFYHSHEGSLLNYFYFSFPLGCSISCSNGNHGRSVSWGIFRLFSRGI